MSTVSLQMLYITSCTDALMWYADRVGQFVPLMNRLPEGGWLSQEPGGLSNIVHKLDAEEVTVFVSRPKMGQWPHIEPRHKLVHIVRKDVADRARAWAPPEPPKTSDAKTERKALAEAEAFYAKHAPGMPYEREPKAQCRDACMLGSCKGLGDCQEARAKRLADLCKDFQAETEMLTAPPHTTGQSRRLSAIEAATNIVLGFGVSVVITALLLPAFGHHVTLGQNVAMTSVFTVASFVRAYGLRRLFNLFNS